ncbi:MAG: hypothetical protein LBU31_02295 [Coriobacteriales bacterium]|jgi:hypothetical protein|nr:hypothetical protein [Coriobacteriales bacterium]
MSYESCTHPLTLRWRIHEGRIVLRQRHLRSLEPLGLPAPLRAWLHERLEWAASNMLNENSEGVLVIAIDPATDIVVSLDKLREPPHLTTADLVFAAGTGAITGVQHEGAPLAGDVWLERDDVLYASCDALTSATGTLARDLAQTLNITVVVCPQQAVAIQDSSAFLISDEFGFVPLATPTPTPTHRAPSASQRLRECFDKLW